MKARNNNQIIGTWLLLLYLFSLTPVFLFHQHDHKHQHDIVAFEQANDCEKTVYYAGRSVACHDKAHIGKQLEKCKFCADHTSISTATIPSFPSYYIPKKDNSLALSFQEKSGIASISISAGRGPPQV